MYQSKEISKSTYLLTDVWYCKNCLHGYIHESFQHTIDPNGKKWTISVLKFSTKKIEPQSHIETQPYISKSQHSNRLLIHHINIILPSNINQCGCGGGHFIKTNIVLVMKSLEGKEDAIEVIVK
jgi:hypothetical protein